MDEKVVLDHVNEIEKVTLQVAVKALGVSRKTIYEYIQNGLLT